MYVLRFLGASKKANSVRSLNLSLLILFLVFQNWPSISRAAENDCSLFGKIKQVIRELRGESESSSAQFVNLQVKIGLRDGDRIQLITRDGVKMSGRFVGEDEKFIYLNVNNTKVPVIKKQLDLGKTHKVISSTASAQSEAGNAVKYFDGKRVDVDAIPVRLPEGSKVFVLGNGRAGGKVFRVEYPNGRSEVYKLYKGIAGQSGQKMAEADYKSLKILYDLSKQPGYKGFRVVRPSKPEGNLLRLEYTKGETVSESTGITENGITPSNQNLAQPAQRKLIEAQYNEKLDETFKALKRNFPSLRLNKIEGSTTNSATFKDADGQEHVLFFHRGNILVDPTGTKYTIIDPF